MKELKGIITGYQASQKYDLSLSHIRYLMRNGKIEGRLVPVSPKQSIWLIKESSLKAYLAQPRLPGPKPA